MGPWLAFLLAVCAAQNQEPPAKPEAPKQEPESKPVPYPGPEGRRAVLHFGATGRGLVPVSPFGQNLPLFGPVGSGAVVGSFFRTSKWSDFFKPGIGGSLEVELLWEDVGSGDAPPPGDAWISGAYATIGVDRWAGRKVTDDNGQSIDPESLGVFSLLVGPKVVKHFEGGYFADARLGLGLVHYSEVDADIHPVNLGAQDFRGEFIAETTTFGMELGIRGGLRTGRMSFVVGGLLRFQAGPGRAAAVGGSPNELIAVGVDLGVELGF